MGQLFPGSAAGNGGVISSATSIAQQTFVASTRKVVEGTLVQIPTDGLKVGTRYRAQFNMTKTAAGAATSTVDVATIPRDSSPVLANATARVSFTKPAGTGAVDEGVVRVDITVRVISATVGILVGILELTHNLAATGHAQTPCVNLYATSASFDNSDLAGGYLVTCMTTGASDAIVSEVAAAELYEPGTFAGP